MTSEEMMMECPSCGERFDSVAHRTPKELGSEGEEYLARCPHCGHESELP